MKTLQHAMELVAICCVVSILTGCTGGARTAPAAAASGSPAERAAALLGNDPIGWTDLRPSLNEAAGGVVLEEVVLDLVLRQEASQRGVAVTPEDVQQERRLLVDTLARTAEADPEAGEALLENVRRARGLGEVRFRSLLERNALLRALVRSGATEQRVEIDEQDLRQAYELKHGPRVRARLLLVPTRERATEALARLRPRAAPGDPAPPPEPFETVAREMSLDPSGARGGLLEPFSPADPTYPVAIRREVERLQPGQLSDPIAVSWSDRQGFAVLRLEERIPAPAAPAFEAVAEELESEVRLVRERALMDRLARRLLANARLTVLDRSLGRAWEQRRSEPAP